jgi:glycosyltransferase involved in cell wall biosynthesis
VSDDRKIVLRTDVREWLERVGTADLLIGIPSFNNAGTIGHVVRAVQAGLAKYFPDARAVLVNSDGGSTDGTRQVVEQAAVDDFQQLLVSQRVPTLYKTATLYQGVPGKGSAFRTVFEIADALGVNACAVVDSDLRSITPEWVELLLKPVLGEGFDYVAPLYLRHKYDGTITNSIIYPLTRAMYGRRVRQPIGGDFGFSGRLVRHFLKHDVWGTDVARYGIDIWMTTTAIAGNFDVCQSFLGAKIHDAKDPGADLSAMLYQVVSAAFDLMETYHQVWTTVRESMPVPTFGFRYAVGLEPVAVNVERMLDRFMLGARELGDIWRLFLPDKILEIITDICGPTVGEFHMPDEVWVEIIYRYALAKHNRVLPVEHLLKSLTPLYLGRIASFVLETRECSAQEVEERIEALCNQFEIMKPLLVSQWEQRGEVLDGNSQETVD